MFLKRHTLPIYIGGFMKTRLFVLFLILSFLNLFNPPAVFGANQVARWEKQVINIDKIDINSYKANKLRIAVIDTGVDVNHPWFKNVKILNIYISKGIEYDYKHGTMVTDI